jgi:hypothetical protein
MAKTAKKREPGNRYVWRDDRTGRLLDVIVRDPPVKPRGVSVGKIKEAVRKSGGATVRRDR